MLPPQAQLALLEVTGNISDGINVNYSQIFLKMEEEEVLPTSLWEASITKTR